MTDAAGLRSISTFRPLLGRQRRPRWSASSAMLTRVAQRRHDRFLASISGHSGLGMHVQRHARLLHLAQRRHPGGYLRTSSSFPFTLRRYLRRRRRPASGAPDWPESRPQHGRSAPFFLDDAVPTDQPPRFADDPYEPPMDEIAEEDPWHENGLAPTLTESLVLRHAGFLGRDVLPPEREPESPVFATGLRAAASASPFAASLPRSGSVAVERLSPLSGVLARPLVGIAREHEEAADRGVAGVAGAEFNRPLLPAPLIAKWRMATAPVSPVAPSAVSRLPLPIRRQRLAISRGIHAQMAPVSITSAALPIAPMEVEQYSPPSLSQRQPGLTEGAVSGSADRIVVNSPSLGGEIPTTVGRMAVGSRSHTAGWQPPLRRLFALAQAMDDSQTPMRSEGETSGSLGPLWYRSSGQALGTPRHPLARVHAAVRGEKRGPLSTPAMLAGSPLPASAAAIGSPADHVVTDSTFGGYRPVVARRRLGGLPGLTGQVTGRQAPGLPIGRTFAQRFAAHDEPFAPTMRLMHATAMRHILRRLPPTAGAPSLAATLAHQQRRPRPGTASAAPASATTERQMFSEFESRLPDLELIGSPLVQRDPMSMPPGTSGPLGATFEAASHASPLARVFVDRFSDAAATPVGVEPVGWTRQPWPLLPHRTADLRGQLAGRTISSVATSGAGAAPEVARNDAYRRRPAPMPAILRRPPEVVARAIVALLGDAPPSPPAEQAIARSAIRRAPVFNATYAPVFPGSTLPAPAPRGAPWPVSPLLSGTTESLPGSPSLAEGTPGSDGLSRSPFVARQIERIGHDLRVSSSVPLLLARKHSNVHQGEEIGPPRSTIPSEEAVAWSLARPVRRLTAGAVAARTMSYGAAAATATRATVRPLRVAPPTQGVSTEVEPAPVRPWFSQIRVGGRAEIDTFAVPDEPLSLGLGFSFVGRRRATSSEVRGRASESAPFPGDYRSSPMPWTPGRQSAVRNILRQPSSTWRSSERVTHDLAVARAEARGTTPVRRLMQNMVPPPSIEGMPSAGGSDVMSAAPGWHASNLPVASGGFSLADLPRFMRRAAAQRPSPAAASNGPIVFRSALPGAGEPSLTQRSAAAEVMAQSSGQPLPPMVRRSMEHLFRMDLAAVRVHSGPQASRATDLVAARAMASGADVFLPGGVNDSPHGADLPLLAHELTHVAHHFGRRPPSDSSTPPLTLAHRTASTEQDAERIERMVATTVNRQPHATSTPPSLTLARKPAPVTIMRVDEGPPASGVGSVSAEGGLASPPAPGTNPDTTPAKQDQQKLADQVFHMLEQRLIIARERGGHRL